MKERAVNDARKAYEAETLEDDDARMDRVVQTLSDLMPIIEPIIGPVMRLAEGFMQYKMKSWGISEQPTLPPTNGSNIQGPSNGAIQEGPPSQLPQFDQPQEELIPGVTI
jgi:hypothetical protein